MTGRDRARIANWDEIWKFSHVKEWDYLSEVIYETLLAEIGNLKNRKILEAGCGTGRISLRLGKGLAQVVLIDLSRVSIEIAKERFARAKINAELLQADLFNIPFKDNTFDVVWNAGVSEHYPEEKQHQIILEMVRVCKKGGIIVAMNGNINSLVYFYAKRVIEILFDYPYGFEKPVASFKNLIDAHNCFILRKEYSIGFTTFFTGGLKMFSLVCRKFPFCDVATQIANVFDSWLLGIHRKGRLLRLVDKLLVKLFRGYLLVSVFEKQ